MKHIRPSFILPQIVDLDNEKSTLDANFKLDQGQPNKPTDGPGLSVFIPQPEVTDNPQVINPLFIKTEVKNEMFDEDVEMDHEKNSQVLQIKDMATPDLSIYGTEAEARSSSPQSTNDVKQRSKWNYERIKCLLSTMAEHRNGIHKLAEKHRVFSSVVKKLNASGGNFTIQEIKTKWSNLLGTYRRQLRERNLGAKGRSSSWDYFEDVDQIFVNAEGEVTAASIMNSGFDLTPSLAVTPSIHDSPSNEYSKMYPTVQIESTPAATPLQYILPEPSPPQDSATLSAPKGIPYVPSSVTDSPKATKKRRKVLTKNLALRSLAKMDEMNKTVGELNNTMKVMSDQLGELVDIFKTAYTKKQ